jgi:hypothetical protein
MSLKLHTSITMAHYARLQVDFGVDRHGELSYDHIRFSVTAPVYAVASIYDLYLYRGDDGCWKQNWITRSWSNGRVRDTPEMSELDAKHQEHIQAVMDFVNGNVFRANVARKLRSEICNLKCALDEVAS